ncbi:MAG: hypothetical protein CW716_12815 [Candidatus Bathyarchaeum sp.]|nr:MAG: hypothetical protein CW716_12815 [Candidatus Bathyarchaeum sp.]
MLAFVLAKSVPDNLEWVIERIGKVEGIEEVFRVWRAYDIVARASVESIEELQEIVLKIQTMKHVLSTTTLMELKKKGKLDFKIDYRRAPNIPT